MARLALFALVGVLAVAGAFAADAMPEAVPDRGQAVKGRTLAEAVPAYFSADAALDADVPGDSLSGGYGYYPAPNPPSDDEWPEFLGKPLGFKAVFPGDGNALFADEELLASFKEGVESQLAENYPDTPVFVKNPVLSSSSSRRLLQGTPVEVDYALDFALDTPDSVLAATREQQTTNPGEIFPTSFTSPFGLSTPTITSIALGGTPPPPPGGGQSTASPPPRPPPPSSAGRTPLSLVMTLLALFGSAMLISLL